MKPAARQWQLWGVRSAAIDRVLLAAAASALLWLLGAWAMDWL